MTDRFLPTSLRRALERDIKEARRVAEEGAADAIRRLGVADPEAPAHLSDEDKAARRRLRAHARALGDTVTDGVHTVDHLIEAAAYAQWHRRLFARFLAERGLLRHPVHGVAVTLDEAEELAAEEGFVDGWSAAESYAARMLPAVFQPEDPVLALTLAPEHAQGLRKLVLGIDAETFQADDSLGWTYQFWRALEKDRVNKSGGKIGARELPAVTQLFTEPYMVKFLLHNTLGAWRASKVLAERPELATDVVDEAGLRAAVSPPGYQFDMLRFVREGEDGPWRPAAGTFAGWPQRAAEVRALDPCCGSGHFLTEMLAILTALRADEDGLSDPQAVAAVLSDNLFGLELDGRCVQIAAFAVALTAWRIGGFQPFGADQVHIAWVGAPPPLDRGDFLALANGDEELRLGLAGLHDLFVQAPLLGSLIEPLGGDLMSPQRLGRIEPLLDRLVQKTRATEPERVEGAVAARGMADAAALLSSRYTLVATNVPFLTAKSFAPELKQHVNTAFPSANADLANAMIYRWLGSAATVAAVSPHGWLYQVLHRAFRASLVSRDALALVVDLAEGAFDTAQAAGAFVSLTVLDRSSPRRTDFATLKARDGRGPEKARALVHEAFIPINMDQPRRAADNVIALDEVSDHPALGVLAPSFQGTSTGDNDRFLAKFWEFASIPTGWQVFRMPPDGRGDISGCSELVRWSHLDSHDANPAIRGERAWGQAGIVFGKMRDLPFSLYGGEKFSNSSPVMVIKPEHLSAVWAFVSSGRLNEELRKQNPSVAVENGYLNKIPFDLDHWSVVAAERFPDGLPEPYTDSPTQWLFHGHPEKAEVGTQLHVALARLAGYRWPAEVDTDMRLSPKAREWIAKAAALPAPDADGILPLGAVGAERPLADRLRDYLNVAIPGWDEARLVREADERIDKKVGRDLSLEGWLRDRAFRQHSALFHNRPFLWQVWDGQKDGFSAFLHYHRLDHAALQKLTYTLLGAWITRREAEKDERRVEAAKVLKQKLEMILEGEAPHDIFVRWKPLAQQPLGWNPDLDDGVRLNIRPWVTAGVLREAAPKGIKWGVDRGKDVASAPWFPLDKGVRNNDRHTTLAEKQAAGDATAAKAAKA